MYYQFTIQNINEPEQELLISELSDCCTGFLQEETSLHIFATDFKEVEEIIANADYPYDKEIIPVQNWNQNWERSFNPVMVMVEGKPFVHIRASFHLPEVAKHTLLITPKMSFGTGHHATTAQVIELMHEIDFKDKKVIDFGTGTGVLAILAEKLGAKSVIAIDNDDWSLENASENCSVNDCSCIQLIKANLLTNIDNCDILLANINLNVILNELKNMNAILPMQGKLLLSGMLAEDTSTLTTALEATGFEMKNIKERLNWIAVYAVKTVENKI